MIIFLYFFKNMLLVLLLTTPFIACIMKYKYGLHLLWVFPITCLTAYFLIIGTTWATSEYLNAVLQSYDLDGNGFFQDDGITYEQEIAMKNIMSDTARALALFLGLIVTPTGVALCFRVCAIMINILKNFKELDK